MKMSSRLDRLEDLYRTALEVDATIAALSSEDRSAWDVIAARYDEPVSDHLDPDAAMDPSDFAVVTRILARGLRAIGLHIPLGREDAEIARYQRRCKQRHHRPAASDLT